MSYVQGQYLGFVDQHDPFDRSIVILEWNVSLANVLPGDLPPFAVALEGLLDRESRTLSQNILPIQRVDRDALNPSANKRDYGTQTQNQLLKFSAN
jgi:hypothetical protein